MGTKWRKSKASGKIDYTVALGKGLRDPCRCLRLWRVALWQEVGNTGAALLATFQSEPQGNNLPSSVGSQFYTREAIGDVSVLLPPYVNYEGPAGICQPLFADGGSYQRDLYPASAVYALLNFAVVSVVDWKLENIYNEKWILSYFQLEFSSEEDFHTYPNAAAMIAALPATWAPLRYSFGTGYKDIWESSAGVISADGDSHDYTGTSESMCTPTTTETNVAPNSPYTLHTLGRDELQFVTDIDAFTHSDRRYQGARCSFLVCKFTDFKFFNTLVVRCKRFRPSATVGRSYMLLSTYQLVNVNEFNDLGILRIAIDHPIGTNNYEQIDVTLTGNLLRNGRDLWLYVVPGPLPELGASNPTPTNCGLCTRDGGGTGYPTDGVDTDIIKDIEFIPTFTYGGTP